MTAAVLGWLLGWVCWSCCREQPLDAERVRYGRVDTCRACEAVAQATIDASEQARFDRAFTRGAL